MKAAEQQQALEQAVIDALGQVIWEARREEWQGDVKPMPLRTVLKHGKLLVGRLRLYVTKTAFQALYSVICRANNLIKEDCQTQDALDAARYACEILTNLFDSGLKPSNVPDVAGYKGTTISDSHLLKATTEAITLGSKSLYTPLFSNLWQLLVAQAETNPKEVLTLMQRAMNDEHLKKCITLSEVFPVFIECLADTVVFLSKGDISNWHDLVITLLTDSLKLQQQPDERVLKIMKEAPPAPFATHLWLGSLDLHRLTAFFVVLNNIHVFQKTVNENYSMLLDRPVPMNGITERLFGTGGRTSLLRTCVVKSLINVGKNEKSGTVIHAGVLGTAAQHAEVFDQHAEVALRDAVAEFFMESEVDLGTTGLTPELEQRTRLIVHTLSCARTYPSLKKVQLPLKGPKYDKLVKDVTSIYMGIILADEFLFADRERKLMNLAFINSRHIINHHAVLLPYKHGMIKLLKSLKISVSKEFIEGLWEHAQAIDALVGHCIFKAVKGKSREDKNVFALLVNTFPDVLKLISHSAPATDRPSDTEDPNLPEISRMCVEIMGCYFPAVPYTSLPPLPVDRDGKNSREHQAELRRAIERRADFKKLETSLQRHIGVLNRTRPYTEKIIDCVFQEEEKMKKGDRHAVYKLCYWLFCLRNALTSTSAVKRHAVLVPKLLRFVKNEYPKNVLIAAHAVIVKLLKEPSVAAATSFPLYLNECIPMRPVPGGGKQLALHHALLATQSSLLIQHFTMNIRAICQKLEEWDINLSDTGDSALPPDSDGHPTGVGLVLYAAEALKQVILKLSMSGNVPNVRYEVVLRKRRLYINALVNLLQCLNTDVLTHVCSSLEAVFSSLTDIKEVTFWLGYTSKAIKGSENPSTKQQVVAWFLRLQSLLSPEKLGIRAKL